MVARKSCLMGRGVRVRLRFAQSERAHQSTRGQRVIWLCAEIAALLTGLLAAPSFAVRPNIKWITAGHLGRVSAVVFSPDGQTLASCGYEATIKIWRVSDGAVVRTLIGHPSGVYSLAISPDGKTLASGSSDKSIKLWRLSDGALLRTLTGHTSGVKRVAFSPDGLTLASAGDINDGSIKLWRVSDGSLIRTLTSLDSPFVSVAFSPDGKMLASACVDGTIKLLRVSDGSILRNFSLEDQSFDTAVFSPDGQTLAGAGGGGYAWTIPIWRISDGALIRTIEAPDPILAFTFSPDGKMLAGGTHVHTINIWRVSDGTLIRTISGQTGRVGCVAFSPDGQTLASGSSDQAVKLWRVSDGSLIRALSGHTYYRISVALSPNGQTLASGCYDSTVKLWRVSNGSLISTLSVPRDAPEKIMSVVFSPDGQLLASGGRYYIPDVTAATPVGYVDLWRVSDGSLVRTLSGHSDLILSVAFSPDGRFLASGSVDKSIKLWRVSDGALLRTLSGHTHNVWSVVFSPDGQILASGSEDGTIKLWRVSDGSLDRTLSGKFQRIYSVAFSPDGQLLAGAGVMLDRAEIALWRVADGSLFRTLSGHSGAILSVAFFPNGQTLVSGSYDSTVRLWRVWDGEPQAVYDEETYFVGSVAVSKNGDLIAWGRFDPTVVLAYAPPAPPPPTTPVVDDGGQFTTSTSQLSVRWSASASGSSIVEYLYAIGTSPTDPGSSYVVAWKSAGTATQKTETGLTLQDGVRYYWYVRARSAAGAWSSTGVSDGITVDGSPPSRPNVVDEGTVTFDRTQLWAYWSSSDPHSGITEYRYAIGTAPSDPGSGYVFGWIPAGSDTEARVSGLNLQVGVTYYWYVQARNGAGLWSTVGVSDGIKVSARPPSTPVVLDTGVFTGSASQLSASWSASDAQSAIVEYRYAIGTSPTDPGSNYVVGWKSAGTATQKTETGLRLQDGVTYYWYVRARNAAGLWSEVGVSDGIKVDASPPIKPRVTDEGFFVRLPNRLQASWQSSDPHSGVVEYRYAIGTSPIDPGSGYVVGWKSAGSLTQATEFGLTLQDKVTYYWYVQSQNGAGQWSAVGVSDGITMDSSPPSKPVVVDSGWFSSTRSQLSASCRSFDPNSGIKEYRYAIGTSPTDPGSGYLVGWKSAGLATRLTETDLALQEGATYYWYVRARNGCGLWSAVGVSDGITVDVTPPDTVITGGPGNSGPVYSNQVTFAFAGTDNLTDPSRILFQWKLDAGKWSAASREKAISLKNLTEGTHTLQVRAVDLAGNVDPTLASITWPVVAANAASVGDGAGRAK